MNRSVPLYHHQITSYKEIKKLQQSQNIRKLLMSGKLLINKNGELVNNELISNDNTNIEPIPNDNTTINNSGN